MGSWTWSWNRSTCSTIPTSLPSISSMAWGVRRFQYLLLPTKRGFRGNCSSQLILSSDDAFVQGSCREFSPRPPASQNVYLCTTPVSAKACLPNQQVAYTLESIL